MKIEIKTIVTPGPDPYGNHEGCEWLQGFLDGLLREGEHFPAHPGEPGHRKKNRDYNFGFGAGQREKFAIKTSISVQYRKVQRERVDDQAKVKAAQRVIDEEIGHLDRLVVALRVVAKATDAHT